MMSIQPVVAGAVISFAFHAARASGTDHGTNLTPRDKIELSLWQDRARLAGFDRLVVHERDENDAAEVGSFLAVHRSGEPWSRWSFARTDGKIHAWCSLSGADVGVFRSLGEALGAVLLDLVPIDTSGGEVVPFLRMGSAA